MHDGEAMVNKIRLAPEKKFMKRNSDKILLLDGFYPDVHPTAMT